MESGLRASRLVITGWHYSRFSLSLKPRETSGITGSRQESKDTWSTEQSFVFNMQKPIYHSLTEDEYTSQSLNTALLLEYSECAIIALECDS